MVVYILNRIMYNYTFLFKNLEVIEYFNNIIIIEQLGFFCTKVIYKQKEGDITQLEECVLCKYKVIGSSPIISKLKNIQNINKNNGTVE